MSAMPDDPRESSSGGSRPGDARADAAARDAPRPAKPRRWRLVIAIALVAAVIAGAFAVWQSRAPDPAATVAGMRRNDPAAKPAPVAVATARSRDFDVTLDALGTVTPRASVTVRSRVDGQLARVLFREGDMVKAGQLLAEIDPRTFEVQLAQANAQLAKDRALLANARTDLERYRTLLAQDSIARQQVDTQESLVRQSEATIAADQALVDSAALTLSYTRVGAPIAGRLGLRQVDAGNMIHASDANGLVLLTQLSPIDVVFSLPEANLPAVMRRMRSGEPVAVEARSRDQSTTLASGRLLTVDNSIDTSTGTVKLKAEFANADQSLFPNQFVNVRMRVDTLKDAVVVPTAAIQRGTQGTFVYVVGAGNVVALRVVRTGPADGESTVVQSGVAAGDVVVVDGVDRLREGQAVETVTRDTTVTPTGAPRPRGAGRAAGKGEAAGSRDGAGAAAGKGVPPDAGPGKATPPAGG
jgi:multidrug efflux system membrane fusion protein